MTYPRFAAMVVTSILVMFAMMYSNTYALEDVWFSQTRAWMALLMGAGMAIIMMAFMFRMYPKRAANIAIMAAAAAILAGSLWLVRSQATVDDVSYMEAMIPHHSIAVMTSERAHIHDARVRQLANGILLTQIKKIAEMEGLIADLKANPIPLGAPELASAAH